LTNATQCNSERRAIKTFITDGGKCLVFKLSHTLHLKGTGWAMCLSLYRQAVKVIWSQLETGNLEKLINGTKKICLEYLQRMTSEIVPKQLFILSSDRKNGPGRQRRWLDGLVFED
jgi:hypothetical protein